MEGRGPINTTLRRLRNRNTVLPIAQNVVDNLNQVYPIADTVGEIIPEIGGLSGIREHRYDDLLNVIHNPRDLFYEDVLNAYHQAVMNGEENITPFEKKSLNKIMRNEDIVELHFSIIADRIQDFIRHNLHHPVAEARPVERPSGGGITYYKR
jgi:hypothetical protein